MPKATVSAVREDLRRQVYDLLGELNPRFIKVGNKYGIILTDLNGEKQYVRLYPQTTNPVPGKTAEEVMQDEIDTYNATQERKAEAKRKSIEKTERDKARREAMAAAKKAVNEQFKEEEEEREEEEGE